MEIRLERSGTVQALEEILTAMENEERIQGIMILACDQNAFTPDQVDSALQRCSKPVFGGIFPMILHETENLDKGTLVVGLEGGLSVKILKNLSLQEVDLDREVKSFYPDKDLSEKTIFVFVDGFSSRISALNESMFNFWGLEPNYIGGGAGSLSFIKKPCIFTNQGLLQDGAVFALSDARSGIGVAHGWEPVSEPFKVTSAENNVIHSLNWKPAAQVYQDKVQAISGRSFAAEDFFQIAKAFPLGIARMAEDMIVRDPIGLSGESIVCVGEVPENAFVQILTGDREGLLKGAASAKIIAETSFSDSFGRIPDEKAATFFIDCISRVLFLEKDFPRELEEVQGGRPLFGALTIGEIANTGNFYLEFYNKTSVVALLED